MKKTIYHGWTKSYSQGSKIPTIKEKPNAPKKVPATSKKPLP